MTVKKWVLFSLVRVAVFVIPFAILVYLNLQLWFAGLIAAVIGLSISFIFLNNWRGELGAELQARRTGPASGEATDEEVEDRIVDEAPQGLTVTRIDPDAGADADARPVSGGDAEPPAGDQAK